MQEMCNIHPGKEIIEKCAHCGKGVCVECAATLAGKTYCQDCIKVIDAAGADQIAWENRGQVGLFNALFTTWKDILLHPKRFFSNMPTKAAMKGPLLFALICGSTAIIIAALFNVLLALSGTTPPNLPIGQQAPSQAVLVGSYITLMVISPLMVCAGVFIGSAVYHLLVLAFGGRQGFIATFRVLCYVNALAVFNVLPIVGPVFVTVYSVILFVIGFKNAHKMGTARAVMIAVIPMLILFIIVFAAAVYLANQGALPGGISPAPTAAVPVNPPLLPPTK